MHNGRRQPRAIPREEESCDRDPCAPGGWAPGRDRDSIYRQQVQPHLPPVNVAGNPCDPRVGLDIEYKPVTGRALLSAPGSAEPPPQLYEPISATLPAPGWIDVIQARVPQAFSAVAVKVITQLNLPGWEAAVEWALWIDQKIVGDPWNGVYSWPDWRPLAREVWSPGAPVRIRVRVLPEFWATGATPINSLLVAQASMFLYNTSVAGPC